MLYLCMYLQECSERLHFFTLKKFPIGPWEHWPYSKYCDVDGRWAGCGLDHYNLWTLHFVISL